MIYDPRENLDPPDPELERLLAWFTQNRAPIAREFRKHGAVIRTIYTAPTAPCDCGSGRKFKKCCGRVV